MGIFMQNNLILILILVWSLPWKGYALWTAAKRGHKIWFVALLVLNTLAILDIVYLFVIVKKTGKQMLADIKAD